MLNYKPPPYSVFTSSGSSIFLQYSTREFSPEFARLVSGTKDSNQKKLRRENQRERRKLQSELLPLLLCYSDKTEYSLPFKPNLYAPNSHSPSHLNRPTVRFPDRPSTIPGLSSLLSKTVKPVCYRPRYAVSTTFVRPQN